MVRSSGGFFSLVLYNSFGRKKAMSLNDVNINGRDRHVDKK
jgi:hypothetical protein